MEGYSGMQPFDRDTELIEHVKERLEKASMSIIGMIVSSRFHVRGIDRPCSYSQDWSQATDCHGHGCPWSLRYWGHGLFKTMGTEAVRDIIIIRVLVKVSMSPATQRDV